MRLSLSILVAASLGGWADATLAQDATPAPPAAPAAAAAPLGHIPAPPPGKAEVVFFRSGAMYGAGVWFKVRENGQELGKLSNQSYFVAVLDPGPHTFTSAYELQDKLKLELDPGETYYVRGTMQSGLLLVGANLALVDAVTFEKHYGHLHIVRSLAADAPAATEKAAQ